MTTIADALGILNSYLEDVWSDTDITWENTPIQNEEDFIRPIIDIDYSENVNIGAATSSKRIRHYGAYTIYCHFSQNVGAGEGYRLASKLVVLFSNLYPNPDIMLAAGTIRRIGNTESGWYQLNVIIPFTIDEY